MIKSLKIQNFQSHKDTELEFEPGVNVIIGQSDSGKTAILRALQWLIWNRPLGDAFRSDWGGDTHVTLETDDCRVVRFKGKGGDHYLLDPKGHEKKAIEFKAFGTEPPEEILQALNLSDINVQNQMDSSFLLSNNSGEVARHFNKIAKIDQIDTSLKAVESWVRSLTQDKKAGEKEIARLEIDLADFKYLDKMEAEVEVLEQLQSKASQAGTAIASLSKLLEGVEQVDAEIAEFTGLLAAEDSVNEILEDREARREKIMQHKTLKELGLAITEVQREIEEIHDLVDDEQAVNSVLDLYNKVGSKVELKTGLYKIIQDVLKVDEKMEMKLEDLETLEIQWHENMPETCPLCGK